MQRQYPIVIKFPNIGRLPRFRSCLILFRDDFFIAERTIQAVDRTDAVKKALRFFWANFVKSGLRPQACLTVGDPFNEVVFERGNFHCHDLKNMYLSDEVIERLTIESSGLLIRDNPPAGSGRPIGSVRRTRRNIGPYPKTIAPCIYKTKAGTLYYMVTAVPQRTVGGMIVQKQKEKLIKLAARTLAEAIAEIRARNLRTLHRSIRWYKRRSLKLAEYLSDQKKLTPDDLKFFAPVIKEQKRRRSRASPGA